jgi:hypothetical protein
VNEQQPDSAEAGGQQSEGTLETMFEPTRKTAKVRAQSAASPRRSTNSNSDGHKRWSKFGGQVTESPQRCSGADLSRSDLRRARSLWFALRMAIRMKGAANLVKPLGAPRFLRVILVAPLGTVSQV